MSYLLSMFVVLTIGMSVLMSGSYVLDKGLGFTSHKAVVDSVGWGVGFLILFGAEFAMLAHLV